MYSLQTSETTAQDATSGASFGNLRGGGSRFAFGGINDSAGAKWLPWAIGGVAALLLLGLGWFLLRKP